LKSDLSTFRPHRMHEMRPIAIDDFVAWVFGMRATIHQMAPRFGRYYITVAACMKIAIGLPVCWLWEKGRWIKVTWQERMTRLAEDWWVWLTSQKEHTNYRHPPTGEWYPPHILSKWFTPALNRPVSAHIGHCLSSRVRFDVFFFSQSLNRPYAYLESSENDSMSSMPPGSVK